MNPLVKALEDIRAKKSEIKWKASNYRMLLNDINSIATNALSLYSQSKPDELNPDATAIKEHYFKPLSQSKEGDWVKVEDELPPSGEVMWIWDGKEVSEWRFNGQAGKTNEEKKKYLDKYNITHWAYFDMPEPPKK